MVCLSITCHYSRRQRPGLGKTYAKRLVAYLGQLPGFCAMKQDIHSELQAL
jgi:hypothetical protein